MILILNNSKKLVKSISISKALGVTKQSTSKAVHNLQLDGYINIDEKNNIFLTDKGLQIASSVYERHTNLIKFLVSIGVTLEQAEIDGCKMEHVISEETFSKIKEYLNKIQIN